MCWHKVHVLEMSAAVLAAAARLTSRLGKINSRLFSLFVAIGIAFLALVFCC